MGNRRSAFRDNTVLETRIGLLSSVEEAADSSLTPPPIASTRGFG